MTEEEESTKYVYVTRKYGDDRWYFIKNDAELETWKKEDSFVDGDYIVEIKKLIKVKEVVEKHMEFEEIKKG
jgi:hypothetical protein